MKIVKILEEKARSANPVITITQNTQELIQCLVAYEFESLD